MGDVPWPESLISEKSGGTLLSEPPCHSLIASCVWEYPNSDL